MRLAVVTGASSGIGAVYADRRARRGYDWSVAGKPVENMPPEIVMSAEDMVDAALAGFDQGEFVTHPRPPGCRAMAIL
jgi:short-subunit dehydrogenase